MSPDIAKCPWGQSCPQWRPTVLKKGTKGRRKKSISPGAGRPRCGCNFHFLSVWHWASYWPLWASVFLYEPLLPCWGIEKVKPEVAGHVVGVQFWVFFPPGLLTTPFQHTNPFPYSNLSLLVSNKFSNAFFRLPYTQTLNWKKIWKDVLALRLLARGTWTNYLTSFEFSGIKSVSLSWYLKNCMRLLLTCSAAWPGPLLLCESWNTWIAGSFYSITFTSY